MINSSSTNRAKRPLCFVLMPFGKKPDPSGLVINFDAVYSRILRPAIEKAGLAPLRADEELIGGIIHKPMFERLILCEYAVADLTTANGNVLYELGVRHGIKPFSTTLVFAEGVRLPFDVAPLRGLPYRLSKAGRPIQTDAAIERISEQLIEARNGATDSPVFQLLEDFVPPAIAHLKTDTFRERADHSAQIKQALNQARKETANSVRSIQAELGYIPDIESGIVIDLLLSYRAVGAHADMIQLVEMMHPSLAAIVLVQEQLAFAHNRLGHHSVAQELLEQLIALRGPSSETYGLLGRVFKDQWEGAVRDGRHDASLGFLLKAIDAYRSGFEADWRDAYPGVNALTLMELKESPDEAATDLLPVVIYSVQRKIASAGPDYWDHATLLELEVLSKEPAKAQLQLADAVAEISEYWQPETTARNLRLIRESRERRGEDASWISELESVLNGEAERLHPLPNPIPSRSDRSGKPPAN